MYIQCIKIFCFFLVISGKTYEGHIVTQLCWKIKTQSDWLIFYTWYCNKLFVTWRRATHAVPTLICQGPSFYIFFLVKKGHYSKTIAFRVMPLVFQLHLVMMRKYSKSGVNTFNTFWVMGYIKDFPWCQRRCSTDQNSLTFSSKQMS